MKVDSVKLLYNAAAHFAACEKYPDGLISELRKESAESFDAMFWAFAEMAKQAELFRRFMGDTPKRILTVDEWRGILRPGQMGRVAARVMEAFNAGLATDDSGEEEIDEVLLELEKKTKKTG